MAGCAFALCADALSDMAVLQFPPSLAAAAVLIAARRAQVLFIPGGWLYLGGELSPA